MGICENASSRNNYQLPAYHRLDLGANFYRYKKNGRMGIWNLSLCNAYFKGESFLSPAYLLSNGKRAGGRVGADLVVPFRPFCFLYI